MIKKYYYIDSKGRLSMQSKFGGIFEIYGADRFGFIYKMKIFKS